MAWSKRKGMQKRRATKEADRHQRAVTKKEAIADQTNGKQKGKKQ